MENMNTDLKKPCKGLITRMRLTFVSGLAPLCWNTCSRGNMHRVGCLCCSSRQAKGFWLKTNDFQLCSHHPHCQSQEPVDNEVEIKTDPLIEFPAKKY